MLDLTRKSSNDGTYGFQRRGQGPTIVIEITNFVSSITIMSGLWKIF